MGPVPQKVERWEPLYSNEARQYALSLPSKAHPALDLVGLCLAIVTVTFRKKMLGPLAVECWGEQPALHPVLARQERLGRKMLSL